MPATENQMIQIEIKDVHVETNVRKHFEPGRLKELAENIEKVGVLEPLLVRKNGDGYKLIAGERRLRAAKLAKLDKVPVRVLDVDDKQAAEIQAFENLHREDLTPIEEARAFKMLLDVGGHTIESLAERVDKSVRHVYRAMALLALPAEVLDLIESDKLAPAHGHQLLRAPEEKRISLGRAAVRQRMTAADLQEAIDRELGHDLAKAPFQKDKPFAGKPACIGCPLNSDNQQDLLGEIVKGRCTGADCYKTKIEAHIGGFAAQQKDKMPDVKFIRTVDHDYQATPPPGMMKLPTSAAVLAQVKKDPQSFRAAIVRERDWNDPRPALMIFGRPTSAVRKAAGLTNASSSGGGSSPDQRPSRMKAIAELATAATRRDHFKRLPKSPTADLILKAMQENGHDDAMCQILQITPEHLKALTQEQMIKAVYFAYSELGYAYGQSSYDSKKKFETEVKAAADKVWPKSQTPACKVCHCTPFKACQMKGMGDFQSCWWVNPGLCSSCHAAGKTIPVEAKSNGAKR